jgi:hypothetical protein
MSNVDKFFKDKLEEHQLAPSPMAWTKVEERLVKKNKTLIWLRWAASIALAGLLTFFLINQQSENEAPALVEMKKEAAPAEMQKPNAVAPAETIAEGSQKSEEKKEPRVVTNRKNRAPIQVPAKLESTVAALEPLETQPVVAMQEPEKTVEPAQPEVKEVSKAVVLIYSLPSRPTVQLDGATLASNTDEKQTGIQKLWEAAKDVKNSDNPWGELREAKNELLALDFKKDKNRNQ